MNYKYILTAVLIVAVFSGTASAWLTGYDHRMAITVNNGGASELNYYQFNFTNDTNTLVAAGDMQASGADCRVTDSSDNLIPFWNETAFNVAGTKIWANATTLTVGDNTFYMYYGNLAATAVGDIDETFIFADDFDGVDGYSASRAVGSSLGFNAATPRVVVADNGIWLMVYRAKADGSPPTSHEGQVWIRNSTDEGETWSSGTKLSSDTVNAINAAFIKYPNGDIDIFYTRYNGTSGEDTTPNMVSRSTNNGTTWGAFATAPTPLDADYQIMQQDIAIGTDVYLVAFYKTLSSSYHENVFYKTTDDGVTWSKIGDVTTYGADGECGAGGVVYLGSGEFVCVIKHNTGSSTVQKRSTNWGATWTTDGYIKDDGSVAAAGVGTDVYLHQNRLWNKDISGNDLGYIYMQSNLYPGSYPRDMYAYFSTDNCTSWGSRSLIEGGAYDSGLVLKTSSAAKYYPGRLSGESETTSDNITISVSTILDSSKWSVGEGTDFSVDGELTIGASTGDTGIYHPIVFPAEYSVRARAKSVNSAGIGGRIYLASAYGAINAGPYIAWAENTDIQTYYDSIWYRIDEWAANVYQTVEMRNVDNTAYTFDAVVDDVVKIPDAGFRYDLAMDNIVFYYNQLDYDFMCDWILVRKYTSPDPTSSLGAEEDAPSGGAYNITLPLGWSIIGWTNATDCTAHYAGGLIGSNCTYVTERNRTTGLYTTHVMAAPDEDNFAIERGWGYFVSTTAETLWERDT